METLKKHRTVFFRKIQTESLQRFLSHQRQEIVRRENENCEEVVEYDFEFNDQLRERLKLVSQSMHENGRLTQCIDSLERLAEFLQSNFELLQINQQILMDSRIWEILLPSRECIFINSLSFCLTLLDIIVIVVFVSSKMADAFIQHNLLDFLRQAMFHRSDANVQEAFILILTSMLYRDQTNLFQVFMELVDEENQSKGFLEKIELSNLTLVESLCLYMEGLVQTLKDHSQKKRAYSFVLRFAELEIVDILLSRLFKVILFCWKNDNSLIPSLVDRPYFLERLVKIIDNSREETLLAATFSILGNLVGFFDQTQLREISVEVILRPTWLIKVYHSCFRFLTNTYHKISAQAKCLFLLYNTIEVCKDLNTRENFIRIFELFLTKGPIYEMRNSVECAEEILKLLKLVLERSKIEQQIELVSLNLSALDLLFGYLVNFSQADIALYALHTVVMFLNIDKVIEIKLGQSIVREYIIDKNFLSRLDKSLKHPDNRVKSMTSYLIREYLSSG
jgi:hypothetical protein